MASKRQGADESVPGQHTIGDCEEHTTPASTPTPDKAAPQHGAQDQPIGQHRKNHVRLKVWQEEAVVYERGQHDVQQQSGLQRGQAKGPEVE